MDPGVAALDFAKAGAIIANMIESYLAAGASPFNAEGADHAEPEDCRSSSDAKSLHLHSSVDDGASAIQSGEHRAPIQSSRSSEVAWLDAGADPNPRRGSCPVGRTDDQAGRLQDPCERCGDGTSRRDLLSGIFTLGTLEQGLASITGTVRRHQNIGVRRRWLLRSVRLQRQPCPRHERHVRASRTAHHSRASTAQNSTERRKVSCAFHCQLVWYSTATRSFSIPTRKCKAPSGRSSRCSNKRTAPMLWFNASTRSAFSFRVGRMAVYGMANSSGVG